MPGASLGMLATKARHGFRKAGSPPFASTVAVKSGIRRFLRRFVCKERRMGSWQAVLPVTAPCPDSESCLTKVPHEIFHAVQLQVMHLSVSPSSTYH
jgi:hypothetical protein